MNYFRLLVGLVVGVTACGPWPLFAQAPGVKIVRDRGEEYAELVGKASELREAGQLLSAGALEQQLARTSCTLSLPKPSKKRLSARQIWQRSRDAHVRVGWYYLCNKCEKWHLNLAGGCFITADGAIATCFHVVKPNSEHREAYLVAAVEEGSLFPVIEILAGNEKADTAIVRAKVKSRTRPLALSTNVYPGDGAWCYSDPLGRSSYFSEGMVNRFYYHEGRDRAGPRIEVSTDWAPGSSGAAVVDECGNAIGFVSTILPASPARSRSTNQTSRAASPMIVFHCASRAADVLSLIRPAGHR